jgi:hypothetical protein
LNLRKILPGARNYSRAGASRRKEVVIEGRSLKRWLSGESALSKLAGGLAYYARVMQTPPIGKPDRGKAHSARRFTPERAVVAVIEGRL